MGREGYQGGITTGGKWGCAAAAFVGTPLFFFLVLGDALGDCVAGQACHKGFLLYVALPTFVVALAVGLMVRALVNRFTRKER